MSMISSKSLHSVCGNLIEVCCQEGEGQESTGGGQESEVWGGEVYILGYSYWCWYWGIGWRGIGEVSIYFQLFYYNPNLLTLVTLHNGIFDEY